MTNRRNDGYVTCRFICENAPTNKTQPISNLDGHGYEVFQVGNGPGFGWMSELRTKRCRKCGGQMVSIDHWTTQILRRTA